ncbi:MAG: hypothetical protein WD081_04205 [Gammaproteobacteria bacterium]
MKWLGAVLLGVTTAVVPATEWREIPYADLHAVFSRDFVSGAKYARMTRSLVVHDETFRQEDLQLVVAAEAGSIAVVIDEDGVVDNFPVSEALLEENPPVRTNAPKGKLAMTVEFTSTVPPTEQLSYAIVIAMADEYRELVKRQGFVARLMMPKPKGLLVEFGPNVNAHALIGGEVIKTDEDGTLTIPLRRGWNRRPPLIEFSLVPIALSLQLDV